MPPANSSQPDKVISEVLAAFLEEKTAELSPYSVAHLRATLVPLTRALCDPPITAITYSDLRDYIDRLYLRYRPGTIRPIVGDIRQFFRWCKRRGRIKRNPAKRLKPPSRRVLEQSAEPKAAPEEDIRRIFDHLAECLGRVIWRDLFGNLCHAPAADWTYDECQAVRDLFILSFLYETGARAGELWRLGIAAMEAAVAAPGPVYCAISTGKTGNAALRFTRATTELWSVWRAVHPGGDHAVVGWKRGRPPSPMTTPGISKTLIRWCARAGVPPFRAHALRHAKIRRGVGAVGMEVTSRLVGHGSAIVTAGYARPDDDELNAAALATGLEARLWR